MSAKSIRAARDAWCAALEARDKQMALVKAGKAEARSSDEAVRAEDAAFVAYIAEAERDDEGDA